MNTNSETLASSDLGYTKTVSTCVATAQKSNPANPMHSADTSYANDRVSVFSIRINSNWQDTVESIRRMAEACAEANETLTSSEKELFALLPFSQPQFSKLATISSNKCLADKTLQKLLPASISTMYELAKLSDDKLQSAICQGRY